VGIVAIKARIGRELATVRYHVLADVDLRKVGGPRFESAVAQLAQLVAAVNGHLCKHLSLLEIGVEGYGTVAELAPYRSMDSCGVLRELFVVAHAAGVIAAVTDGFVAELGHCRSTVWAELTPGFGNEERPAEDHRDQHDEQQNGGSENVFGVQQRALRVHAEGPPWNAARRLGPSGNQPTATSE